MGLINRMNSGFKANSPESPITKRLFWDSAPTPEPTNGGSLNDPHGKGSTSTVPKSHNT